MKKIAIIGAGGFGREVLMLIKQINRKSHQYEFIGFFDDNYNVDQTRNNYPILGEINDLNSIDYKLAVVVAIGDPITKKKIITNLNNKNINFPTLIHPNVSLCNSDFLKIGDGCIIASNSILTTNIVIGNHVIINLNCTIGHDVVINNYCSFMPSVNISGEVHIDNNVYIGTNATIINQLKIGKNATIGAGAVIIKNVPDGATVVGNPGKIISIKNTP